MRTTLLYIFGDMFLPTLNILNFCPFFFVKSVKLDRNHHYPFLNNLKPLQLLLFSFIIATFHQLWETFPEHYATNTMYHNRNSLFRMKCIVKFPTTCIILYFIFLRLPYRNCLSFFSKGQICRLRLFHLNCGTPQLFHESHGFLCRLMFFLFFLLLYTDRRVLVGVLLFHPLSNMRWRIGHWNIFYFLSQTYFKLLFIFIPDHFGDFL